MIWKTTNGLGQEVTWYSAEKVRNIIEKIQNEMSECFLKSNSLNNCQNCQRECNGEFSYIENLILDIDKQIKEC